VKILDHAGKQITGLAKNGNMIKLTNLLKEAGEKEPSSITVKSPISKQIVKMAFEQESPNTKYKINGQEFEFNFRSFCKNWHDTGIEKDQAWKSFFLPIAQTIKIIDDWASVEDVIFIND